MKVPDNVNDDQRMQTGSVRVNIRENKQLMKMMKMMMMMMTMMMMIMTKMVVMMMMGNTRVYEVDTGV